MRDAGRTSTEQARLSGRGGCGEAVVHMTEWRKGRSTLRSRRHGGGESGGRGGDWLLLGSLMAILFCCLGPLLASVSLGVVAVLWHDVYVQAAAVALALLTAYRLLRKGRPGR